jgi:hypothetical protein
MSTSNSTKPLAALLKEAAERVAANPGTLDAELAALSRASSSPDVSVLD